MRRVKSWTWKWPKVTLNDLWGQMKNVQWELTANVLIMSEVLK